jgi:hypothetical protein
MSAATTKLARNDPRHGTENGYGNLGCRCERCRRAHRDDYWRNRRNLQPHRVEDRKKKYAIARAAGYSVAEARRRCQWSDPLADAPAYSKHPALRRAASPDTPEKADE